jgi:protein gp37
MADNTVIEWTDATWNPVTGCDRVSPGCAHCYALELAPRLRGMAEARGTGKWLTVKDGGKSSGPAFGVTLHPEELSKPLRWRKPKRIFVNSMSDLFHEEVPDEFILRVFDTMRSAHVEGRGHVFQVLTKRPERMRDFCLRVRFDGRPEHGRMWLADAVGIKDGYALMGGLPGCSALPNVWLGVSIENRQFVHRADLLRETPAAVRFISAEPLLGPLVAGPSHVHEGNELDLTGIDWLIVGGESGPKHRLMREDWVRDLRDACLESGHRCPDCDGSHVAPDGENECERCEGAPELLERTAFFFKQWGGPTPKSGGRLLDSRTWDEMPMTGEKP